MSEEKKRVEGKREKSIFFFLLGNLSLYIKRIQKVIYFLFDFQKYP